jgi:glycerate 2-kinase
MNILIAPDKFKGSLTAQQVCDAVASAILKVHPEWNVQQFPMADGGEGTCHVLTSLYGGKKIKVNARDPLFREIETYYGLSPDGRTAFIETASASGLQLLKPEERNPRFTSTIGTGDLIAHALRSGVKEIIIGCGGSATNDGGMGLASAVGISFLDSNSKVLHPVGENLSKIHSINADNLMKEVANCSFTLLSDVDNPLTGPEGAAYTFAAQKGANTQDIEFLDSGLKHFASVIEAHGLGLPNFSGAGAAGGLPVSARVFLKAQQQLGVNFIMAFGKLEEKIMHADLVITGEGKLDQQSLHGKVVSGIAKTCTIYQKKIWVICGINELQENQWRTLEVEKVVSLSDDKTSKDESIKNASALIHKQILALM